MKIFIDTADVAEIREVASWGIVDGVTTNPSLVAKTGRRLESVVEEICAIVDGPVSVEVVSLDAPSMVEDGKRLARPHKNVVVKIPCRAGRLRQRDARLLGHAGAPGREGGRHVREPFRGAAR